MQRYLGKLPPPVKNSDGNTCCRWCNNVVIKPRRTLCSPICAHEIKLRCSNRYMRDCTFNRDKGICTICNIDTKLIAKQALSLIGSDRNVFLTNHCISIKRKIWKKKHGGGLWDADHIIPVKKGGGLCGMENIRTLCIGCHRLITSTSKSKTPKSLDKSLDKSTKLTKLTKLDESLDKSTKLTKLDESLDKLTELT